MRVLVTGGREFRDREWLYGALELLHSLDPITELIEGGAAGADCLAANWAIWRLGGSTTVKADWKKHGSAAGPIRNRLMAHMDPDVVLACPGGNGTADMVTVAKLRGIQVVFLEKMPVGKRGPLTEGPQGQSPDVYDVGVSSFQA